MRMIAARFFPTMLVFLACGGGEDGPRGPAGAAGGAVTAAGAGGGGVSGNATVDPSAGAATGGATAGAGGSGATSAAGTPAAGAGAGGTGGAGEPGARPDQRTVLYLPDYRGSLASWQTKIDSSRMSYLNLSFAEVSAEGDISYKDAGLAGFVSAAHQKGVKVCIAIGGASTIENGGVYATILKDDRRDAFVGKLVEYAVDNQLDCIDVDLEGNGVNQYYEAFVTTLATKLHEKQKELTCAVSSWFGDKITDKALQSFDFVNVMAYDLHNPGGSSQPVQSSSVAESKAEVDYWVGRGLPKEKAVFGVPFYGYGWQNGKSTALTYAEILATDPSAATRDEVTLNGSTTFLNSRATIIEKAKLAMSYGGIMVWEWGQDAPGDASLLKAIADATP